MINKNLHRTNFLTILQAIYTDPQIRTLVGFKGGTAAMLFYDLPRFSVDLDFDLLDISKKQVVFTKIKKILNGLGNLSESAEKQYTLFYLLHYRSGERTLKVEISKRVSFSLYELKHYLGIGMLVMKQEDMTAGKLSAMLTRKRFASRDLFDLWFFLKNNWPINEAVVAEKTNLSLQKALKEAILKVKSIKKHQLLQGLGELLESEKQKSWVKEKMGEELVFLLKMYLSEMKREKSMGCLLFSPYLI